MKNTLNIKIKRKAIIFTLAALSLLSGIIYFGWPYISVFFEPEKARAVITQAGAWAPFLFIIMQIIQVLIAPIPGQVVGLIGGYLFGPFWGIVYTIVGSTIGFTLIFLLARRFGRPFVERFVPKRYMDKFDYLSTEKGALVFFLIFLLPAFPDDIISFIAGLTTIKISTLIIISISGRLPGYVILCLTGDGLTYKNFKLAFVTIFIIGMLLVISWWKREWLYEFVKQKNRIKYVRDQLKSSWVSITLWTLGLLIATIVFYQIADVLPFSQ